MQAGRIRGLVVIPVDFAQQMARDGDFNAPIRGDYRRQRKPNTANFVRGYVGIWQIWQQQRAEDRGDTAQTLHRRPEARCTVWPAAISQHFIILGR